MMDRPSHKMCGKLIVKRRIKLGEDKQWGGLHDIHQLSILKEGTDDNVSECVCLLVSK